MLPPKPPNRDNEHVERKDLIQLHITEYTALTTRATYFISLAVALFTIIPLYLAFIAPIWTSVSAKRHGLSWLVWGSAIVIQIVLLFVIQLQCEQYQIIFYIETQLRPNVRRLVQYSEFWQYESFLKKRRRPQRAATWWENVTGIVTIGLLMTTVLLFQRFIGLSGWDVLGIAMNVGLCALLFVKSWDAIKIRQRWEIYESDQ